MMEKNPFKSDYLKIQKVVKRSQDWEYWLDSHGATTYVSPSCEVITGYSSSEFMQNPELVTRIIHPDDLSEVGEHFRSVELGETSRIEFRIITAFNTVRWLSRSYKRMISDTGTYAGIRVTNSDITFRKNLELELRRKTEQLERSNKDLEQFAYAAAHDLREPLVAVAAQLKALERLLKMNTNEGVQRTLSRAMNHVLSMDSMLQAIFSCSSVNSTPSSFEISDANVCLKNAISNLAFSIKKSGTVVTSDNLPLVNIGASQLMTIFRNLIAYSIKFRNAFPPRIHVGCAPCRSVNQFHVTDNGMGIAPPYLDRIFRLLDRVHDISGPMNAGIGLLTCRSIVEQYGGNLWLDSKPAQGSTFFFTLPAVDMETSRTSFTEAKLGCS